MTQSRTTFSPAHHYSIDASVCERTANKDWLAQMFLSLLAPATCPCPPSKCVSGGRRAFHWVEPSLSSTAVHAGWELTQLCCLGSCYWINNGCSWGNILAWCCWLYSQGCFSSSQLWSWFLGLLFLFHLYLNLKDRNRELWLKCEDFTVNERYL